MGYFGWGSAGERTSGYTDDYVYSDGVGIPVGRQAANGLGPIIITSLEGWVRGRNSSRGGVMKLEPGGQTSWFTVGAAGSAAPSGHIGGIAAFYANGGSARFVIDMDGSFYFGRGGGGNVYDSYGYVDGRMLGGAANYVESPTPPKNLSAVQSGNPGQVDLYWNWPDTDGGTGYSGMRVMYKKSSVGSWSTWDIGAQTSANVTGLEGGVSYDFAVAAKNQVTDWAGTTSHWSNVSSVVVPGPPTAPTSLSATPSTNAFGQVALSWTAPSSIPGGLSRYNVYANDVLIGNSTSTTYTATGLTPNIMYGFRVAARNKFTDDRNTTGPSSSTVTVRSPGPPEAPSNLTGTVHASIAGRVDLSWTAPASPNGAITRYSVYFSTGEKVADTASTSYTVTGLTPATQYGFYIRAWNSIADNANTPGPQSNTYYATALGEPDAPTNFIVQSSSAVSGRLILTWTAPTGTITGYTVYQNSPTSTPIGYTNTNRFVIDNLEGAATRTYYVRARNAVTDNTGSLGGPASSAASGAPTFTTNQTVSSTSVQNNTNQNFNGTVVVSAVGANTLSYSKVSTPMAVTPVPATTITNVTNSTLSGSATITAVPTSTSFSYAKTIADIGTNTPVANGKAFNTTNQSLNGTKTVTAINTGANQVSYASSGSNITASAAFGTIINQTNAQFNGENIKITAATKTTLSYAKTGSNVTDTQASGTIINVTNRDVFNGVRTVTEAPTYQLLSYATSYNNAALTGGSVALTEKFGTVRRTTSPGKLEVLYRSGWAG